MIMDRELIIGQFNDSFPPAIDGVATTLINYANYFQREEGACYAVVPYYPNACYEDFAFPVLNFASLPVPFRRQYRFFHPGLSFKLTSKLMDIDFDILHVHSPFTSGRIALNLAKKRNIPIVATFHTKYRDDIMALFKSDSIADKMIDHIVAFYHQCDAVWVVNKATGKTLEEYGYKKEYRIAPNGCDFPIGPCTEEMRDRINERFHIPPGQKLILYVGQHTYQKNTRLIVKSIRELKEYDVDFKMLFVGDGDKKNHLEQLAARLGLADDVIFAGSIDDRHLLNAIYKRADLFLFPSIYDNAPLVVREAAAGHTPSLLIEGSNAAEGIRDNDNGFLVSYPGEREIGKRLYDILSDGRKLREVGQRASETVCVPWETVLHDIHGQYRDILHTSRDRQRRAI